MARGKVRLNMKGLEEVALRADTAGALRSLGEQVAENVRGQHIKVGAFGGGSGEIDLPVTLKNGYTTDMRVNRAKVWVTLAHPAGIAVQAKRGALTNAASEAGLNVKGD